MIPFTDSYQRGISSYLQNATGQQPAGWTDTPGAEFDTAMAENPFVQSRLITKDLSDQTDKAAAIGETLPHPVLTQNWLDNRSGNDLLAQEAKDSLASYNAQIADINKRKGTNFLTPDQIFQARADVAKQQEADASKILSRATTPGQIFGELTGGMAGTLVDPMQAATLLTPMSIESFGGNLALRLLKVAGTQAVTQGGVTLLDQDKLRDFYKAQGLSDDQVDAKIWQSAEAAAVGGAVFAPALNIAGIGVNKLWKALRSGTRVERGEAVDALGKADLGVDGNADVGNMRETLDVEGQSPLKGSPTNNRLYANALDEKTSAIRSGDNPIAPENGAMTNRIPNEAHVTPANAPLESELSRSAAKQAQDLATTHEQTAIQSDIQVQSFKDEKSFLTAELKNKNVSVDALEKAGAIDSFSANAVREIDSKLALSVVLSPAEKSTLQATRTQFIKSAASNYRKVIQNRIDTLKSNIKETNGIGKQARLDAQKANADAANHLKNAQNAERITANPITFKTSKGSTYRVDGDGTIRNKAYRQEHGVAEQGIQEKSQKTFYVDDKGLNALGEFQTKGTEKVVSQTTDGRYGIKYVTGKDAGKFEKRTVTEVHTEPAVGLHPVELWNDGKTVHFGNKITEVNREEPPVKLEQINKAPMSSEEVVAHVEAVKQIKETEPLLVQQAKAALEQSDHVVDGQSMRDVLKEMDEREKELNEYLNCIGG